MKEKLPIKLCDIVIILLALGLTGFSAYSIYFQNRGSTQVLVEGQGGRRWVYPLDASVTLPIPGPLGNTIIRIEGNEAWVERSPCDNQVCVAAGKLYARWHFAACLPNAVLVMIEGNNDNGSVDSTTR